MPRSAPVRNARFDLLPTHQGNGYHIFDGVQINNITFRANLSATERASKVIEYRSAGMWFKDIATLFGFSTASQASAFYVRECRLRGVAPIVRERAASTAREILDEEAMDSLPEFLNRDRFTGERDFTFGVELECIGIGLGQAQVAVTSQSLACQNNGYTHNNVHTWKCVPDGSLRGRGGTAEVVSRVLKGKAGLSEMRRVQKSLKAVGAKVNRSCGMHTHLGVEHLGDRQLAMIIRLHCVFQEVLDLVTSQYRRRNRYFHQKRTMSEMLSVVREWSNGGRSEGTSNRYKSLNLASYEKYGTFEMRSYDGCLNPRRASAWIQLHMDFFQFCMDIADNTMGRAESNLLATDTIRVIDPLTQQAIFGYEVGDRMSTGVVHPHIVAPEEARAIFAEWIDGPNSFITNPKVREILKQEIARNNPNN